MDLANRVTQRHIAATAGAKTPGDEWVYDEVLTQRTDGGIEPKAKIERFLKNFTRDAQDLHKYLEALLSVAKKSIEGGEDITDADVLKAVQKCVSETFGDDPLAKQIALAIALGKNVFLDEPPLR